MISSTFDPACLKVLIYYIVIRLKLNDWFRGKQNIKINCFPKDQSLSDLLYSWKFIKPRCHGGRRTTFEGNSTLLPFDVIDFAMLPAHRFCRETFSLSDVM